MATEASPSSIRTLFRNRGLEVAESRSQQTTLLGGMLEYHSVSGVRQGSYRITVRIRPAPSSTQLVINASSRESARRAADMLEKLGFKVDADEEVVRAKAKGVSMSLVSRAIDIAEEATRS
ncbi:hypothetical protein CF15_03780 [Pyrodictium occultum]|uniref:Uncharacterized protein n=1 Tax=Pyrodictium occultum TaxID=2309 RepID=A0A0V8RV38_PYROC|nr:hypothetical protein [Pyrodictium occultum]KSW11925.1 hypothetical protein CF15_03780 [Pyrodictium occultum]